MGADKDKHERTPVKRKSMAAGRAADRARNKGACASNQGVV